MATTSHTLPVSEPVKTAIETIEHGGGSFPPFDGSTYPSQLFWLAISFAVFYWLMAKVVLPRIGGILEDRRDRIAGDLAEANRLKLETDAAIAAYEQALAEARGKAHGIAHDTRAKLKAETAERRSDAEAKIADKLVAADKHISEIKSAALAQVGDIATEITGALVETLIGKAPTQADLSKAIDAEMN